MTNGERALRMSDAGTRLRDANAALPFSGHEGGRQRVMMRTQRGDERLAADVKAEHDRETCTAAPPREMEHLARLQPTRAGGPEPMPVAAPSIAPEEPEGSRVLANRYVVLGLLGRGAVGEVYRAYDNAVRREVAVKVLQTTHPEAQERLLEEARAMAKLSHPNVVAVYGVIAGEEAALGALGRVLLTMQYVQGQTLRQWLQAERTVEEVLDAFAQAGRGLAAAHRAGIIHRDFKPENVLVSLEGRVLVTDFGVARVWQSEELPSSTAANTAAHTIPLQTRARGTPWYMAPEQHVGLVDTRADQYAFCVALWEALVRAPIFGEVGDHFGLLAAKLGPLPAWPLGEEVPMRVVNAIYRGLALRPEDRFATMAELLAALTPAKRRTRWAAISAAASVATGVAMFGSAWYSERAQLCSGAAEQLRGVWDEERRERIEASVLSTQLPYAPQVVARIEAKLGVFAEEWSRSHATACEATLRGEQPAPIMDLRMACLHRAKVRLKTVTNLLEQSDAQVVERAENILTSLPKLRRCDDIEGLKAAVPLPEDPDEADAVNRAREHMERAYVLSSAARYEEALEHEAQAELLLGRATHEPAWVELDGFRARTLLSLGRFEESIALLRSTLERAAAVDTEETTAVALLLATALAQRAAHEEATRVLALAEDLSTGCDCAELQATAQMMQSDVLVSQGSYVAAERLARQALASWTRLLAPSAPALAAAHRALGTALWRQHRYEESLAEQRTALAISEAAFGGNHPDVGTALSNIAQALADVGQLEEAERALRRTMEIDARTLSPEHPFVAMTHNNLAAVLFAGGRHAEALAKFETALTINRKIYGSDHPMVATGTLNIGNVLIALGRHAEGETNARLALAIYRKHLDPAHPDIANATAILASALARQGRYAEAEAHYRDALSLIENQGASNHPDRRLWQMQLAQILEAQEHLDEAHMLLEQTWQAGKGEASSLQADVAFALAKLSWRWPSQRQRAVALAHEARATFAALGLTDEPRTKAVQTWLAQPRSRQKRHGRSSPRSRPAATGQTD